MKPWISTCSGALVALFLLGAALHARAGERGSRASAPGEAVDAAVLPDAGAAAAEAGAPAALEAPTGPGLGRQLVRAGFFPPKAPLRAVSLGTSIEEIELSPPFACARAALRAGAIAKALACLGRAQPASLPERYLEGLVLQRAARLSEAAPLFEALAQEYPALADHCRWLAGKSFESLGAHGDALRAYAGIDPGSSLADDARLGQARALRRLGRPAEALAVLEPMAARQPRSWGRDTAAEALFAMAEIREGLGEREAAAALFLRLWSERARSPLSAPALRRAQSLRASPSVELKVARAQSLLDLHRNEQALALIRPIVERPPKELSEADRCRARSIMGRALRKLRRHAQAVEVLTPLVEGCAPDSAWAAGVYTAGMSATHLEPARAIAFYRRLEEVLPESELADDALFLAAGIHERQGEFRQARRLLRRLILRHRSGDYRAEALFQLAWLSRKEGLLESALGAFAQIERDYAELDLEAAVRARYWKARVLDELGRPEEATANYEAITADHPAGFYALLARTQLGQRPAIASPPGEAAALEAPSGDPAAEMAAVPEAGEPLAATSDIDVDAGGTDPLSAEVGAAQPPAPGADGGTAAPASSVARRDADALAEAEAEPGAPEEAPALPPLKLLPDEAPEMRVIALADNPRLASAVELLRLGFAREAAEELLRIDRSALRHPHPPEDLAALTRLIGQAGRPRSAHVVARSDLKRLFLTAPEGAWLPVWKAAYPELFRREIEARAAPLNLDPDLLQALIREESAFDPRAGSWAGAMGLCQLMMPTAREVAGWLRVQGPITRERLFEPDLNIWMGATYLSRLLRQFKGNAALAVAAYNAGAGSVNKFLKRYEGNALDEFIEEIPFEETRHYVKRVLGSMATYQMLYERDPAPVLGQLTIERG